MNIASLSVFDLDGPSFLGLYAVGFCVAVAWSIWRRSRANAKFSFRGAEDTPLTDPYEIAYLAGGAPRCAQVAVVKLIKCGAVEWSRTPVLRRSRLVARGDAEADFHDVERSLFSSILARGKGGMRLAEVPALVTARLFGIESRLAKLGLRPTPSEAGRRGCFIALPLFALMLFGGVKVFIGLGREKPVLFLVGLIVLTCVIAAMLASHPKKLTPAGETVLGRMRRDRQAGGDGLFSVALFGASASGDPALMELDAALQKDISQMGQSGATSGCGGVSGCGGSSGDSSGGGGGGGGGCGGCGGD